MKLFFYMMALLCCMLPFAACESLTESAPENGNRIVWSVDTNGKEFTDDWERICLIERPSWLTAKPVFQY